MSQSYYLSTIAQKLTNINHLNQLHAQLIQNSLHQHENGVAKLISLCTRLHAPPAYTRRIFDSAHNPNATLFTNMLKYCSKRDARNEICTLFREMQRWGLNPDVNAYPILIKAAGRNGVLFHGKLIKVGLDCGKYVSNVLVSFYGKYGPAESARQVFDEMTERGVVDWNAMISGYWKWGNEGEAKALFELMPDRNVITWTTMVTGYSKMRDLENARRYFDRMPDRSVVSWNAMLSAYAQNGRADEALSLFGEMVGSGVSPNETTWVAVISSCSSRGDPGLAESVVEMLDRREVHLNVFVKTALFDLYAKCGRLDKAEKIFDGLGVQRNLVAWNSMISAYTRTGDLVSARRLFDQMPEKNVVTWNSMICGYAQNGQSAVAVELFKEMVEKGIMPDEVTMASVISACGHLGALELGNSVVGLITGRNINLSASGHNSLIYMYSRCGSMRNAETIFYQMENRDVVSHNALITGFAAHGNGVEALELFQKMKDEGIEPDRITYIGVLTACSHAGMLEEGRRVFESIEDPDVDHYACIVDLMGRQGKLDEAKRIIEKMPMDPPAGIYGSLLNASQIYKRIDLAEFAANNLFELEPENSGNYVLLSNMYASAGKWKEVKRIRELMKTRGVRKTSGVTWMEHERKMHRVMVGDRSHEQQSIFTKN